MFDLFYNGNMRYKKEEITAVDKICFATTKLVLTNGYHDVNVSDIIKEADVSRSTFYVYFKNKEEIIIRICDHILDHVFSKHLFILCSVFRPVCYHLCHIHFRIAYLII